MNFTILKIMIKIMVKKIKNGLIIHILSHIWEIILFIMISPPFYMYIFNFEENLAKIKTL